jgi:hypothetical protein
MEAIMSVKEPSEKARNAAFALLVTMGQKMKEGGVVDMSLLEGATANSGAPGGAREASVQEFMGMVGASLAAEKDHTISAGVMALSRVLFEFKGTFSPMPLEDVDPDLSLVQVTSPRNTSRRFSTPSTPYSLHGIGKLSSLSLDLLSFVSTVSPPRSSSPNYGI